MAKSTTTKVPTAADIRKKYAADSSRQKFLKLDGKSELCIFPFEHDGEMHIWMRQTTHFVAREKRSYHCAGENCHHCRKEKPRDQFVMNAYNVKTRESGLWQAPPSAWDPIASALGDDRNTHLLGGPKGHRSFIITKSKGKGGFTDYEVEVSSKLHQLPSVTPLDIIEWVEGQKLRSAEEAVLGGKKTDKAATSKAKSRKGR